MTNWSVTQEEREYLRDLAKKQLEYALLPVMKEREERWYRHNGLKGEIPMIHFETWTCEQDLLPPAKCTSEAARGIELQIQREILNHERIGDDRVVPAWYNIGWDIQFLLFNIHIGTEHSKDSAGRDLGHQFLHPIKDLSEDMQLLKSSAYRVDRDRTFQWKAFVEDILGDILPLRISMGSPGVCLTQDVVHLMGMEAMIYSLIDYPDEMQEFMRRLTQEHVGFLKWMEKEDLLLLNNGNNSVGQGTFGFTHDLPGSGLKSEAGVRLNNLWGYMDSQETVSISPDMFGEFFFPYYLEVAKNFGLLSYGCCEPVHTIWEKYVSKLPNLRKVSISPWCDEEYMGRALKGTNVIYHRKPSPNFIGVGKELDEEAFRAHILKSVECARDGRMEITFRDVYTLEGNPDKPRRAVEIVREVLAGHWR
jgi:hypothetical protein